MPEVIDAAAPAVTVGTGNGAPTGNGADNRSKDGSNLASQTPQKTAGQIAVEAQNAFDAQEAKTRDLINGKVDPSDEALAEPEATPEEPTAQATEEEVDAEEDDGIVKDKEGHVTIRPTRLKKLLKAQADLNEMNQIIAQQSLEANQTSRQEEIKPEVKVDLSKVTAEKVAALRQKVKEARANFDVDAELQANEELMEVMADAKAEQKLAVERLENKKLNQMQQKAAQFDSVEQKLAPVRDALWIEDQKRVEALGNEDLDLTDVENPFYKDVQAQIQNWYDVGHPVTRSPMLFRRAVEIVADAYGIDLPAIKPLEAAKPVAAPVSSVKPNVAAHRKNGAVVAATSGGKVAVTQEQAIKQLNALSPSDRLKTLAKIMDSRGNAQR